MDNYVKAGITFVGLGVGMILGIMSLAFQGAPYFQWAAIILGFVAGAFLAVGLYLVVRR